MLGIKKFGDSLIIISYFSLFYVAYVWFNMVVVATRFSSIKFSSKHYNESKTKKGLSFD